MVVCWHSWSWKPVQSTSLPPCSPWKMANWLVGNKRLVCHVSWKTPALSDGVNRRKISCSLNLALELVYLPHRVCLRTYSCTCRLVWACSCFPAKAFPLLLSLCPLLNLFFSHCEPAMSLSFLFRLRLGLLLTFWHSFHILILCSMRYADPHYMLWSFKKPMHVIILPIWATLGTHLVTLERKWQMSSTKTPKLDVFSLQSACSLFYFSVNKLHNLLSISMYLGHTSCYALSVL